MSVQLACPRCCFVVERKTADSPPSHCPACGQRMTCPTCGSSLVREPGETALYRCTRCDANLFGDETGMLPPPESQEEGLPTVPGFQIRGVVGKGGMGIVYRAWQERLGREVAIKVLPPALAAHPYYLKRFRNEAAVGAKLVWSHILPVFEVEESHGTPVIVMPLIDGTNLGQIVRDRRGVRDGTPPDRPHPWALLSDGEYLDQVLPVLDQMVEALVGLHREKILHRDIKPSNVLVNPRGQAWLSDFGLARLEDQELGTQAGMVIGTRGYISPEQDGGAEATPQSDLFSLGVSIYQALTLELPFGRSGATEDSKPSLPPSRHQRLLSPGFDRVISKAIGVDRAERIATAEELQADWQKARSGTLVAPFRRTRNLLAACLGVVAVLGLLPVAYLSSPSPRKEQPEEQAAPGRGESVAAVETRKVHVETDPQGARVVLVLLDPLTGAPVVTRKSGILTSPADFPNVEIGEYLVVAALDDKRFHEVFRVVPARATGLRQTTDYPNYSPTETGDGTVVLPKIKIPTEDSAKEMAPFVGGTFVMGRPDITPGTCKVTVLPFSLDRTEVTVRAYQAISGLPGGMKKSTPGDYPVKYVTYYHALYCAEMMGKRLPDESEYEFAATNGGTTRFPWGDEEKFEDWPFGPVKTPEFDKTPGANPVYGLFSNVAEWTTSRAYPYPGSAEREGLEKSSFTDLFKMLRISRVTRGGPNPVIFGFPDLKDPETHAYYDPRYRAARTEDSKEPGLGFRGARSAKPRFLND